MVTTLAAGVDLLVTPEGNLSVASGSDAVRQIVAQHLQFFYGEWFLDRSAGVPYFDEVLGMFSGMDAFNQIIASEISRASDRVTSVSVTNARYSRARRTVSFTANVETIDGSFTMTGG